MMELHFVFVLFCLKCICHKDTNAIEIAESTPLNLVFYLWSRCTSLILLFFYDILLIERFDTEAKQQSS